MIRAVSIEKLIAYFAMLLAGTQVFAVDVYLSPPAGNPDSGSFFEISITLDSATDVVGSYAFNVVYDPSVIIVDAIEGGDTPLYSGAPVTHTASFGSGVTPVTEVQAFSNQPSGILSIAKVRFQAVGSSGSVSAINIAVISLNDGSLLPLTSRTFGTSVQLSFVAANDTDGDGVSDIDEANAGTDINSGDTDSDLLGDLFEINGGLDPLDDGSSDSAQGASGDPDGDGLTNLVEQSLGTHPNKIDTDGDGLADNLEVLLSTDPTNIDSDGDGMDDGYEVDNGLDPNDDGSTALVNGGQGDLDADGLSNLEEFFNGTSANSIDTDGDGLTDFYEISFNLSAVDDGSVDIDNGPFGDPDQDGFNNAQEFNQFSDPRDAHSQPVDMTLNYSAGPKLVLRPLIATAGFSTFDYLAELNAGNSDAATEMELISANGLVQRTVWNGGSPSGDDVPLSSGTGIVVRFSSPASVNYSGKVECVDKGLPAGVSLIGFHCVPPEFTAFQLLDYFSSAYATALQRLNPSTELYETAYYNDFGVAGTDFPIVRGEAYLLNLLIAVDEFDPF